MLNTNVKATILFSILFVFFLQVLSDFIESIYAFGLLVTAITMEVASILLLFTPLLLFFFRKTPPRSFLLGLAGIAIAARLLEPLPGPGGKLVACGISVGAFMMLFPLLLQRRAGIRGWPAMSGLAMALALSIFLRTANSSLDLSESGIFQVIGWLLGVLAVILLWEADLSAVDEQSAGRSASGWRTTGLSVGLAFVVLMMYFGFASPPVLARWTGFSYPAIVIALVATLTVFGILLRSERFLTWLTRRVVLGWNILFTAMLVLTILPHQIAFPADRAAYPLAAPAISPLAMVPLFLMLALSPILFIDFLLFVRGISLERPSLHQLGGSFAVAAFFLLLMVFFHVFTTVYDYIPIIGPLFRDRFWFVYLLTGLGMGLPLLLLHKESFPLQNPESSHPFTSATLGSLALLSIMALFLTMAKPVTPQTETSWKIMTYNIQQGFDAEGNKNLDGQLAVIESVDPDILGLQESDTARVANGNVDAVRYFADKLGMYSYYGPTTTTGTFGVALLSKYPIRNATTFFMASTGEQTAAIRAEIDKNGETYQIFVTHLGNDGPLVQVEDVLTRIGSRGTGQRVILMGDFNLKPSTDQYTLITRTLTDSWSLRWPGGKDSFDFSSKDRIDYIFISPGTQVLESEYKVNPASDHPYLYTVIE